MYCAEYHSAFPVSVGPALLTTDTAVLRGPAQAHITSPEHLNAYAEYCKRTLHNAVNGNLMSKRDRLVHQVRFSDCLVTFV